MGRCVWGAWKWVERGVLMAHPVELFCTSPLRERVSVNRPVTLRCFLLNSDVDRRGDLPQCLLDGLLSLPTTITISYLVTRKPTQNLE